MSEIRDRREKPWFYIDDAVIDIHAKAIGAFGVALYTVLVRHADREGNLFPSHGHLQELLGASKTTIKKYLYILKDRGLIAITPRKDASGDATSNLYTLLPVPLKTDTIPPMPLSHTPGEGVGQQVADPSQQMADGGAADGRPVGQQMATKELVFEGGGIEGEGERNAPAPVKPSGYWMPQEYIPTPLLLEQMTQDCPHIDVSLVLKRCMVTTFRRDILDPAHTFQKFCFEEEERARDLIRRYPTRAAPQPLLNERYSQKTSDTVRGGVSVIERLYQDNTPSEPEERAYATDKSRLLALHGRSDSHGRSLPGPALRITDGKVLDVAPTETLP